MNRFLATAAGALVLSATASAQIGTSYCTANPNSSGQIGLLSATGSTDVTQNNVTLQASQLPPNQFGLYVTSQTQGFVSPPNSNGNLCLGGAIGRYNLNIVNSGATGTTSLVVDLTAVPEPSMLYAVQPGDTVNFQFWHRDGPTASNFTEGLEITFDGGGGLTFENDIYPMLTQPNIGADSCVGCHGAGLAICGLNLAGAATAYANLINVQASCCFPADYVVPGDSAASVLWDKLQGPPSCGGQMPSGG
ncbi:MAG: hypothetical protein AAFR54_20040, partial [Planctomycetota bacterium]